MSENVSNDRGQTGLWAAAVTLGGSGGGAAAADFRNAVGSEL